MSVEVAMWRIDEGVKPKPIPFGGMDNEGRLQQIVVEDISLVDPDLMVIGREVNAYGGSV